MNTRILNRKFEHPADGFYQIEPKGWHPNARAKIVQVIDDKAISSIVDSFNKAAAAGQLRHGHEMLIDHEHFKHDQDKETVAYGWMEQAAARPDGIYAKNRWTATGRPAVDGGDYRFFSTEYSSAESGFSEPVDAADVPGEVRNKYPGWKFVRPLVLTGLTLTNEFNNRGQKPITNRDGERGATHLPDDPAIERHTVASTAGAEADIQNKTKNMKSIASRLGLSADASEEAILGEVGKLINRAGEAEGKLEPLARENTDLKNRVSQLLGDQVEAELDAHGVRDHAVRNRLRPVLLGMTDRDDRTGFLTLLSKPARSARTPLTNRGAAQTPDGAILNQQEEDEEQNREKADKIRNRASELRGAAPARSFADCWNQARRELSARK